MSWYFVVLLKNASTSIHDIEKSMCRGSLWLINTFLTAYDPQLSRHPSRHDKNCHFLYYLRNVPIKQVRNVACVLRFLVFCEQFDEFHGQEESRPGLTGPACVPPTTLWPPLPTQHDLTTGYYWHLMITSDNVCVDNH